MGASNDDGGIPAWQHPSETNSTPVTDGDADSDAGSDAGHEATATEEKLIIARRFLDDENVKNEPRDKKVAFLQSKGVEDQHIQTLLGIANDTVSHPPPFSKGRSRFMVKTHGFTPF